MGSFSTANVLIFYSQENIFFMGLEVDLLRNSLFFIFKGIRSLQKRFLLKAKSLFRTKKYNIYLFIN
jgi:hypothetical protein